jgi:hypothetical protein
MKRPTQADLIRRLKAYREANKRWPLPVSGTADPQEPGKKKPAPHPQGHRTGQGGLKFPKLRDF